MRCVCILLGVVLALVAGAAWAADGAAGREIAIFKGDDPAQDGIELGGWGSGSAVKAKEQILDGSWSIKITTQGLYSGGRLDFARPVELFSDGIDTRRYIVFTFFFKDTQVINPAAGTLSAYDVEPYTVPKASKVRFVFYSDNNLVVPAEEPTNPLDTDDNWVRVAVPMAKFKRAGDISEFRLKRLLIMSDMPTTMYLGEMKIVTDDSPIKVDPLDSQTVALMDDVFFTANARGGVSSLKYAWDFDSSNGIQAEQTSRVARYVYTRGGTFTVTLTVSDADGLKAPVTVSTSIEVID